MWLCTTTHNYLSNCLHSALSQVIHWISTVSRVQTSTNFIYTIIYTIYTKRCSPAQTFHHTPYIFRCKLVHLHICNTKQTVCSFHTHAQICYATGILRYRESGFSVRATDFSLRLYCKTRVAVQTKASGSADKYHHYIHSLSTWLSTHYKR